MISIQISISIAKCIKYSNSLNKLISNNYRYAIIHKTRPRQLSYSGKFYLTFSSSRRCSLFTFIETFQIDVDSTLLTFVSRVS